MIKMFKLFLLTRESLIILCFTNVNFYFTIVISFLVYLESVKILKLKMKI